MRSVPRQKQREPEFRLAHVKLATFRAEPNFVSKHAKLGQLVHWLALLTRPVVKIDVMAKREQFVSKDGWMDSYSIMGRQLGKEEREELKSIITEMQGADDKSVKGYVLWRHTMLHSKVRVLVCVCVCVCLCICWPCAGASCSAPEVHR